MTILYGIHNCDTVKKARSWLDNNNISYQFHDLRKDGFDETLLDNFVSKSNWDLLLNKRSTTFRNLSEDIKSNLTGDVAKQIVLQQPTLLKRPLLEINATLYLGFKPAQYEEIFNRA